MNMMVVRGAKGSSSTHTPVESPDSLINTSYANILDALSEGPMVGLVNGAQSIYFDETPLAGSDGTLNFTGVTWEQRTGEHDQDYITGFPAVESEHSVGVELTAKQPWTQAITNLELSAVRLQLGASTLYQQESDGDTVGYTVNYQVLLSTDGSDYVPVITTSFSGKTTSGYQRSHRVDLPAAEEGWSIRVLRTTPDSTSSSIQATTSVVSYTEVIDAKLQYPYTGLVGLKVDASQFSSIPERAYRIRGRIISVPANYEPATRTYTGTWDGTFKLAWTDNPAWIYRDLILNDRYGLGRFISDSQVDKWALYQIARYCDELVDDGKGGTEPRFTCNLYLQSRNDALTVLQDIASIFRGMAYYAASSVTVSADMPSDPVYTYTNANVIDGKFSRAGSSGSTRYSVAKVSWTNRENFGEQKVEYVQNQKSVARYGIRETELTAFGCVSQGQAQRLGHYTLLTNQLETDTISFSVGLDGVIARPGQVVRVADQNHAGRPIGGRLKNATLNTVVVDDDLTVAAGDTLVVIQPNGKAQTRIIRAVAGRSITVTEAFDEAPLAESIYAIETAEVVPETYRILTVTENFGDDKLQYDVVAVQHNPSKFAAIDNGAQIVTLPTTTLPGAVQAKPTNVALSTFDAVKQGLTVATMRVTWDAAKGANGYNVWWKRNSGDWVYAGVTYTTSIEVSGIYSGTYTARVSAVGVGNATSLWAYSEPTQLYGKTGEPPALASFSTTSEIFGIRLNWTFPEGAEDTLYTEVQESVASDGSSPAQLGLVSYPARTYLKSGMAAGVTRFFRARLGDRSGNTGPWTSWAMGQSSSAAGDILTYLAGQIGETELAQELQQKIEEIDDLKEQIAALDGLKAYQADQAYAKGDMVVSGERIYQASQTVPANTPPPNAIYWTDVGQSLQTVAGLAQQVAQNTAAITDVQAEAKSTQTLRAALREDTGEGELQDALKLWDTQASYAKEVVVRANQDQALVQTTEVLQASVASSDAKITNVQTVVANNQSATAQQISQLQTSIGSNSAAIQTVSQAQANTDGKLSTMWSVKMQLNANGQYVAAGIGLGIENTAAGLQSQFLVSADRFAVVGTTAGGTTFTPFVVQNGQVYISQAFIGDGTITSAKIGDYIQSTNYVAGSAGWRLNKNGTFEINATVAGQGRVIMDNNGVRVFDANGVKRVNLGNLSI
ncbi:TipJ family phage tail tip protein [Pseudomonas massiliensis]|uniref:host specificity protein J n=1 Tax=Pseudomonas massiliensis TaxID=522492 RepID=UPI0006947B8E|nr:phage tail protein [Pseudomonas massiliensis]